MLPGVMPVVGRTDKEAFEKLNCSRALSVPAMHSPSCPTASAWMSARTILMDRSRTSRRPGQLPQLRQRMLNKAQREDDPARPLQSHSAARGHWVLCGSAEPMADTLEAWFRGEAADGFNVMPPYFHEGFEDFVQLVVPLLQARGLFRASMTAPPCATISAWRALRAPIDAQRLPRARAAQVD